MEGKGERVRREKSRGAVSCSTRKETEMHAKESRNSLDPNPGQQQGGEETTKTGSDRQMKSQLKYSRITGLNED